MPPGAIVATRVLGATLVFQLIARRTKKIELSRADWIRIAVCAHLGVVLNQILFIEGLARTTAINAGVIGPATTTVMTGAFAILLRHERPRAGRIAGIATAAIGALILAHVERFSFADHHAVGSALVIVQSGVYALYLVLLGPIAIRVPAMQLVAAVFLCAVPGALIYGARDLVATLPGVSVRTAAELGYLILVPTVFAYSLNQAARARTEASLVAAYVVLQPLVSSTGAAWLLGERPDARTWIATPIVLGGLVLSAWGSIRIRAPSTRG